MRTDYMVYYVLATVVLVLY